MSRHSVPSWFDGTIDDRFPSWPVEDGLHTALVGDTLCPVEPTHGLPEVRVDGPVSIAPAPLPGPNAYIVSVPTSDAARPLLVATEQQLWRIDAASMESFDNRASAYLPAAAIRARGTRWLPSGLLAVATKWRVGLVLLAEQGGLYQTTRRTTRGVSPRYQC